MYPHFDKKKKIYEKFLKILILSISLEQRFVIERCVIISIKREFR